MRTTEEGVGGFAATKAEHGGPTISPRPGSELIVRFPGVSGIEEQADGAREISDILKI